MKTIWKYKLYPENILEIPVNSKILAVQEQHGEPCMWVMVESEAAKQKRKIIVYGTGHQLPEYPGEHIGTFQVYGGDLVFHVFDEGVSE